MSKGHFFRISSLAKYLIDLNPPKLPSLLNMWSSLSYPNLTLATRPFLLTYLELSLSTPYWTSLLPIPVELLPSEISEQPWSIWILSNVKYLVNLDQLTLTLIIFPLVWLHQYMVKYIIQISKHNTWSIKTKVELIAPIINSTQLI